MAVTGGYYKRKTINDKYLHVFEMLFKKLGHEAHYNMMMRERVG